MTVEPAEVGLYFTEQDPFLRLHAGAENFPEPLPENATLPVGEEPATVTLHLACEPTTTEDREQDRVVRGSVVAVLVVVRG